ncbi:hypothetical protein WDU94_010816 [Cyamophila willieti]
MPKVKDGQQKQKRKRKKKGKGSVNNSVASQDYSGTSNASSTFNNVLHHNISDVSSTNHLNHTPQISTSNRFTPLDVNHLSNSFNEQSDEDTPAVKKLKIPPIFVSSVSITAGDLISKMKFISNECRIKDAFKIKDVKDFLKVEITDIHVYRSAINMFDNHGVEYHSYRLPSENTIDVLIKHLPVSIGDNEIQNDLISKGFSVFKLMCVWNKDKKPIPVVNVYLDKKNPQNKEIYNLDRLLHCVVSVEPKRKSYNIPQCNNCQCFGHTRNYCKLKVRCMISTGNHKSVDCRKESTPKCANCGENHLSNFKGCGYYQELRNKCCVQNSVQPQQSGELAQPPPPPPDINHYPPLSPILSSSATSSPSTSLPIRSQDHTYARMNSADENLSNAYEDVPGRTSIPNENVNGSASNSNENVPNKSDSNSIVDCLLNALKPLIEQLLSNIKTLLENILLKMFNGSK